MWVGIRQLRQFDRLTRSHNLGQGGQGQSLYQSSEACQQPMDKAGPQRRKGEEEESSGGFIPASLSQPSLPFTVILSWGSHFLLYQGSRSQTYKSTDVRPVFCPPGSGGRPLLPQSSTHAIHDSGPLSLFKDCGFVLSLTFSLSLSSLTSPSLVDYCYQQTDVS